MSFFKSNYAIKRVFVTLAICSLIFVSIPEKTNAQYFDVPQTAKEYGFDTIAVMIAKVMLKKLTAKTVNWINSGFKGNPAYVTDPGQFFLDVADNTASQVLSDPRINQICSPFKAQVRLALVKNYLSDDQNFSCTLTTLKNNYDAFVQDFSKGGWTGWFEVTQNNQNNPFGAYLEAKQSLSVQVGTQKTKYQNQITQSGGFLSYEKCTGAGTVTQAMIDANDALMDSGKLAWENNALAGKQAGDCIGQKEVVTPGSVINNQLTKSLGSTWGQLEAVNSMNQIVTALVTQLVDRVIGGLGNGLRGASAPSTTGGGSYTSQLGNEPQPRPEADANSITATPPSQNCDSSSTPDETDPVTGKRTAGHSSQNCVTTPGTVTGIPPIVYPDSLSPETGNGECSAVPTATETQESQNAIDFMIPLLEAIPKMNPIITPAPQSYQDAVRNVIAQANVKFPGIVGNYYPKANNIGMVFNYLVGPATIVDSNQLGIGTTWRNAWRVTCSGGTSTPPTGTTPGTGGTGTISGTIDPGSVSIVNAPIDAITWPETTQITNIDFSSDWRFDFSKKDGANRWPDQRGGPGIAATDPIQYTVWLFLKIDGRWVGSGFIQMWHGRADAGGKGSTLFYQLWKNWYYGTAWSPMTQAVILKPGDQIGFMVTSGNTRNGGVPKFRERSNIVLVTLKK